MKDSWLNHGVYPLLEMIGGFQNYFTRVCVWIAAICLLMSLLMMAVKIYLGVTNAREQVIKLIMTFCIYLFLMFIYPIAMKSILPFAMNLGYGAVMGSSNASPSAVRHVPSPAHHPGESHRRSPIRRPATGCRTFRSSPSARPAGSS